MAGLSPAQQMITAAPEVRTLELQAGDEFLVLACDGIWDVLTNQQVGGCFTFSGTVATTLSTGPFLAGWTVRECTQMTGVLQFGLSSFS